MIINTVYSYTALKSSFYRRNLRQNPNFGEVKPEHLFIKMDGFVRNMQWGNHMSQTAETAAQKIREKTSFKDVLHYIENEYLDYYSQYNKNTYFIPLFGVRRTTDSDNYCLTTIGKNNRLSPYINRFRTLLSEKNCNPYIAKEKGIELSKIQLNNEKYEIIHPHSANVKKVLNHIETVYNNITSGKTPGNLEQINKQIGEIHWFFAQATPYYRGSAGIGDILTKAIYESHGIQVSPWKPGVAPDLEAFVTDLEDYKNNYSHLFETPPYWMAK